MEGAIQDCENVPVWLEFLRKEWDRSSIDAHQLEPDVQAQVPWRRSYTQTRVDIRGMENSKIEVVSRRRQRR